MLVPSQDSNLQQTTCTQGTVHGFSNDRSVLVFRFHNCLFPFRVLLKTCPLRATNAKMGPIEYGRRKTESDTRAKCRLFEQSENKVEKVEKERAPLVLTSLPNGTSRSSCHHRHGCIDLVDTRTSRDPVTMRICFVLAIRVTVVTVVTFIVTPLKTLSLSVLPFSLRFCAWGCRRDLY